jgi:hypothetical protein
MDREALLVALKELHDSVDPEAAHCIADGLILKYINDNEIGEAWADVPKWYA